MCGGRGTGRIGWRQRQGGRAPATCTMRAGPAGPVPHRRPRTAQPTAHVEHRLVWLRVEQAAKLLVRLQAAGRHKAIAKDALVPQDACGTRGAMPGWARCRGRGGVGDGSAAVHAPTRTHSAADTHHHHRPRTHCCSGTGCGPGSGAAQLQTPPGQSPAAGERRRGTARRVRGELQTPLLPDTPTPTRFWLMCRLHRWGHAHALARVSAGVSTAVTRAHATCGQPHCLVVRLLAGCMDARDSGARWLTSQHMGGPARAATWKQAQPPFRPPPPRAPCSGSVAGSAGAVDLPGCAAGMQLRPGCAFRWRSPTALQPTSELATWGCWVGNMPTRMKQALLPATPHDARAVLAGVAGSAVRAKQLSSAAGSAAAGSEAQELDSNSAAADTQACSPRSTCRHIAAQHRPLGSLDPAPHGAAPQHTHKQPPLRRAAPRAPFSSATQPGSGSASPARMCPQTCTVPAQSERRGRRAAQRGRKPRGAGGAGMFGALAGTTAGGRQRAARSMPRGRFKSSSSQGKGAHQHLLHAVEDAEVFARVAAGRCGRTTQSGGQQWQACRSSRRRTCCIRPGPARPLTGSAWGYASAPCRPTGGSTTHGRTRCRPPPPGDGWRLGRDIVEWDGDLRCGAGRS